MTNRNPLRSGAIRTLDALGIKEWVKPFVIDLLDFMGVEHAFSRTPEVFEALRRLARPPGAEGPGPRVLVMSFRGAWLVHGTWEALIADGLRRRGARPTIFVCSGGLPEALPGKTPACGIGSVHASGPSSCRQCLQCGTTVASALGLPMLRLDDLVPPGRAAELLTSLGHLSLHELLALSHGGHPIGDYVHNSARWFLCVSDLAGAGEGEAVLRAFARSALLVAEAAPVLLDRVRPDVVLMLNGLFFAERIVRAEARRRGVRVVSYERGFMPDTLCFSEDVPGYYDIGPLWSTVKEAPLSAAQEAQLDDYLAARRKGHKAPFNYWPTLTEGVREVLSSLDLAPERPTAVLFTNITWDSAAQDRDLVFRDMWAWVVATVELFAAMPEAQLVVRVHPAEVRVPGWQTRDPLLPRLVRAFPRLPDNVRVVPPSSDLSSYTLMDLSRCGLVYTSTAGLEMAMEGMPVIVAGEVHYGGKGFTKDPADPAQYAHLLGEALTSSRDPEVRDQARRYGHALFFRFFHPFPIVSENPPDFIPTLTTTDPAALDPGVDPHLEAICRGILEGGAYYLPG